ncbi:MAG TPA: hypothetical protein VKT81_04030 [Bryobacteraceae bacterium]|nr:hypothetical protein [Bryobacteraceae bacterium]
MKNAEPSADINAAIAELVRLHDELLSRVLAIQSVLVKKRVISLASVEREKRRFAKNLAKSLERQIEDLRKRLLEEKHRRQRRMLDEPLGPIQ